MLNFQVLPRKLLPDLSEKIDEIEHDRNDDFTFFLCYAVYVINQFMYM